MSFSLLALFMICFSSILCSIEFPLSLSSKPFVLLPTFYALLHSTIFYTVFYFFYYILLYYILLSPPHPVLAIVIFHYLFVSLSPSSSISIYPFRLSYFVQSSNISFSYSLLIFLPLSLSLYSSPPSPSLLSIYFFHFPFLPSLPCFLYLILQLFLHVLGGCSSFLERNRAGLAERSVLHFPETRSIRPYQTIARYVRANF